MPNKRMPVRRKATGLVAEKAAPPGGLLRGTGRMPTRAVGPERALTWAGEPVNTEAEGLANQRGKLDTIVVNGPKDVFDGDAVDWRAQEDNVARLRRRIFFTATREFHHPQRPGGLLEPRCGESPLARF